MWRRRFAGGRGRPDPVAGMALLPRLVASRLYAAFKVDPGELLLNYYPGQIITTADFTAASQAPPAAVPGGYTPFVVYPLFAVGDAATAGRDLELLLGGDGCCRGAAAGSCCPGAPGSCCRRRRGAAVRGRRGAAVGGGGELLSGRRELLSGGGARVKWGVFPPGTRFQVTEPGRDGRIGLRELGTRVETWLAGGRDGPTYGELAASLRTELLDYAGELQHAGGGHRDSLPRGHQAREQAIRGLLAPLGGDRIRGERLGQVYEQQYGQLPGAELPEAGQPGAGAGQAAAGAGQAGAGQAGALRQELREMAVPAAPAGRGAAGQFEHVTARLRQALRAVTGPARRDENVWVTIAAAGVAGVKPGPPDAWVEIEMPLSGELFYLRYGPPAPAAGPARRPPAPAPAPAAGRRRPGRPGCRRPGPAATTTRSPCGTTPWSAPVSWPAATTTPASRPARTTASWAATPRRSRRRCSRPRPGARCPRAASPGPTPCPPPSWRCRRPPARGCVPPSRPPARRRWDWPAPR